MSSTMIAIATSPGGAVPTARSRRIACCGIAAPSWRLWRSAAAGHRGTGRRCLVSRSRRLRYRAEGPGRRERELVAERRDAPGRGIGGRRLMAGGISADVAGRLLHDGRQRATGRRTRSCIRRHAAGGISAGFAGRHGWGSRSAPDSGTAARGGGGPGRSMREPVRGRPAGHPRRGERAVASGGPAGPPGIGHNGRRAASASPPTRTGTA
jgi:hypothetical protein